MYRTGHLGVSLLLFGPVGNWLVTAGYPALALLVGATMVSLANLPDLDTQVPGLPHRGPTHSLPFAAVVGAVLAFLAARVEPVFAVTVPPGLSMATAGFLLGFGSVLAHLLADVITPMGVAFLWPYPRRWSLNLTPSKDPVWNYGLLALGGVSTAWSLGLAVRLA